MDNMYQMTILELQAEQLCLCSVNEFGECKMDLLNVIEFNNTIRLEHRDMMNDLELNYHKSIQEREAAIIQKCKIENAIYKISAHHKSKKYRAI